MDSSNSCIYNDTPGYETVYNFLNQGVDSDSWILAKTPYPVVSILVVYFVFILKLGPRFMENRRPYHLNNLMRVYNIFQVLANARLIYYPLVHYSSRLPFIIQLSCIIPSESDYQIEELKFAFLTLMHGYLVLKIVDLLDTVFMVLRKKNSHVTFLHVYHHSIMVFGSWYTLKYLKSLQSILPGMINVMVHIIMYSYFFLATFGDSVKKYLWWKKYLTKLQLAQFVIDFIYISALYYYDCPISKNFTYFWLFNVVVFMCLFTNFYIRAYVLKPKVEEQKKSK